MVIKLTRPVLSHDAFCSQRKLQFLQDSENVIFLPELGDVTDATAYPWDLACHGDLTQLMKYVSGWPLVMCYIVEQSLSSFAIYIIKPSNKLSVGIF